MFLTLCVSSFLLSLAASPALLGAEGRLGRMGPDTAVILSLLLGSLLLRRRNERVALMSVLIGASLVINASIGQSY